MMNPNMRYFLHKKFLLLGKYTEEAIGIFFLIPVRIRMKLDARKKLGLARSSVLSYKNPELSTRTGVWSRNAVLPGNPGLLPWKIPSAWILESEQESFMELLDHKIAILSSQKYDVNDITNDRSEQMRNIANGLDSARVDSYKAIDWHRDFNSGYKWDPTTFYLNIKVAPVAGADIKGPRELSRFQHVGILARGPQDLAGEEFILQVADWISANPYGYGVNWACTMDVALRAVNWIWGMRFFEPVLEKHPETVEAFAKSLHQHAEHIEQNLEYYKGSTSNHYLSDICGLLYIGCAFPEFKEADRWVLFGMQELISELNREVYNDGGAHEASTHYHRLVAELFTSGAALCERMSYERKQGLMLVDTRTHLVEPSLDESIKNQLNLQSDGRIFSPDFYTRLAKMAAFSKGLTKPNKLVPQFGDNDSARVHKIYPSSGDMLSDHQHVILAIELLTGSINDEYAGSHSFEASLLCGDITPLKTPVKGIVQSDNVIFPNTGIAVLRNDNVFLAVTCGTNGQLGRGGHGHNDKLSFELNIGGNDYICDGGCPVYTADPEMRNKFRSTPAHSTIHIKHREQDTWKNTLNGLFVLRERSFPKLKLDGNYIEGSHFGYEVPHKRRFRLNSGNLIIEDYFPSTKQKIMVYNFHPDVSCFIYSIDTTRIKVKLNHRKGEELLLEVTGVLNPEVGNGFFSDGYGVRIPTQNLSLQMIGHSAKTSITWKN